MAEGIENAVRALITSLRADGALSGDPAPWGQRVYLRATTDVVQVSGPDTGAPQALTWPCLLLFGPGLKETKSMRRPGTKFQQNFNSGARTVETRVWPRTYELTFRVVWQTRSGVNVTGTTAEAQSIAGQRRFERWAATHRRLTGVDDGVLFTTGALGASPSPRVTAADIVEAVGGLRIAYVREYDAAAVVVPADNTVVVDVTRGRTLPP